MDEVNKIKLSYYLNLLGNVFIGVGLLFLFFTFGPVIDQEVEYQATKYKNEVIKFNSNDSESFLNNTNNVLTPPSKEFSIVIPKINAVAPVVSMVDPYNENEFLPALKKGVAHAVGSSFPDRNGNTYLFAHSTDAFYNVGPYNAVFYLIGKLQPGDEIEIYYQGQKYKYKVYDKKIVEPDALEYLENLGTGHPRTLTLQTCYPPGTTLKRLVILADLIE